MRKVLYIITFVLLSCGCSQEKDQEVKAHDFKESESANAQELTESPVDTTVAILSDLEEVNENTSFSNAGFDDKIYYELLLETHLCDPNFNPSDINQSTPCSSRFFKFFPYNNKRKIEDAFLLQVKAGVNNYPTRRLLIFVREHGKLTLMNGVVGYLVKSIPTPTGIDDLVVAIIDNLGNDKFDRYDVLIRYKEGKYHFVEALGDLQGSFDTPDLKKRATQAIQQRIREKELIF